MDDIKTLYEQKQNRASWLEKYFHHRLRSGIIILFYFVTKNISTFPSVIRSACGTRTNSIVLLLQYDESHVKFLAALFIIFLSDKFDTEFILHNFFNLPLCLTKLLPLSPSLANALVESFIPKKQTRMKTRLTTTKAICPQFCPSRCLLTHILALQPEMTLN